MCGLLLVQWEKLSCCWKQIMWLIFNIYLPRVVVGLRCWRCVWNFVLELYSPFVVLLTYFKLHLILRVRVSCISEWGEINVSLSPFTPNHFINKMLLKILRMFFFFFALFFKKISLIHFEDIEVCFSMCSITIFILSKKHLIWCMLKGISWQTWKLDRTYSLNLMQHVAQWLYISNTVILFLILTNSGTVSHYFKKVYGSHR